VPDDMLLAAIRQNAAWCHLVASTHGLTGSWAPMAWTCSTRTPPLYPDAVTLARAATAREVVDRIDPTTPGASVKDSYATLDLGNSWDVLFEATWLLHPDFAPTDEAEPWSIVGAEQLGAWLAGWAGPADVLRPTLLEEPSVAVVARWADGTAVAGAVLHHDDEVVGLSNLFQDADTDPDEAWSGCLAAAAECWPGHPVVGYESGTDLTAALARGSTPLGPLRVWVLTG